MKHLQNTIVIILSFVCLNLIGLSFTQAEDGVFPVQSNLRAGVAKVDITPRNVRDFEVTGHRRNVTGVRDPLRAGVLVLNDGETEAAMVTLDTIGAWDEMVKLLRVRIEKEANIPAAHVLVAASHNHSSPATSEFSEAQGLGR